MDIPLEKISAADLLNLMQERAEVAKAISVLPENKKVELEGKYGSRGSQCWVIACG